MTQTLKTTERLGVVDALRGFALLAIVLFTTLNTIICFYRWIIRCRHGCRP